MKIMIINDTDNDYHFGCSGTSTAIKQELRKHGELLGSHTVMDSWNGPCCPGEDFTAADFDDAEFRTKWEQANECLIEQQTSASATVRVPFAAGSTALGYVLCFISFTTSKKRYIRSVM